MSTELTIFNDQSLGSKFISFNADDYDSRVQLFNAINNPDYRIADFRNRVIKVRDVVVDVVPLSPNFDESAPEGFVPDEQRQGYRVILIDENNQSYTATSNGIYNSVRTLYSVFGSLHFDEPIPLEVRSIRTKRGETMTLAIVK